MRKSSQVVARVSLLTFFYSISSALAGDLPQLTVAIRTESTQPAGSPILLTLSVTNSGNKSYFYPSWGTSYLSGSPFLAVVTDKSGKVREIQMSNDRGGASAPGGSGGISKLIHGQTIDVPVCIDPLDPDAYKIEVRESKSARGALIVKTAEPTRVVVKKDQELAKKWEQEMLARICKGEPFAQYVAATYPSNSLIELLLQQLLSDDSQVVSRAAYPLLRVKKLPDSSAAVIGKAMEKHPGAMLADLAAKIGTDEALKPVIKLARTEQLRGGAVWALGGFKQEKAIEELHRFLQDENEEFQFRAAQRLSERKDPKALEVLLTVAHDPKSRWRMYSFDALLKYPDDPRVQAAIKSGLDDPDNQVRQSAEFALRKLASQKKKP